MPSTIKRLMSFRLSKANRVMLNSAPYNKHKALLVRMLLDAFFNDELPNIKNRFFTEIKRYGNTTK